MTQTILLIDDDVDLTQVFQIILEREGFQVRVAHDGKKGLELLQETSPDLIILDMNMPGMGGIEFFHKIYDKDQEKTKYPVLVTTARDNLETLFRDLHADGFLAKPFEMSELLKEVRRIFQKRNPKTFGKVPKKEKQVLIVEDDPRVLENIAGVFAGSGLVVCGAKTGQEALEHVSADSPPDLILIKFGLAEIPGDILSVELRQLPQASGILLVLYMAPGTIDAEAFQELERFGAQAGIRKILATNQPEILLKEVSALFTEKN